MIGSLGDVVFEASDKRIRSFYGLTRSGSARFAEHVPIGMMPVQEYLGPGADSASLTMKLHAELGVEPMEELTRLRSHMYAGRVVSLFIGEEMLGDYVVTALNESYKEIDGHGRIVVIDVEVSLKEAGI